MSPRQNAHQCRGVPIAQPLYARCVSVPEPRGPRLRELGLRIGRFEAGKANAITDVTGVAVGHVTVWRDEPEPPEGRGVARTGVTAVLPAAVETLHADPVPAGTAVLNGAGELTGSVLIAEWGRIETPIYLTSTHAVGRVYDGAISVAVAADPTVGTENFVIPVVGECDDSWLSEGRLVQVEAEDVARAVAGGDWRSCRRGSRGRGYGDDDEGLQGWHRHGEPRGADHRRRGRRTRPFELLPATGSRDGRRPGRRPARRAPCDATIEGGKLHCRRRRRRAALAPPARARCAPRGSGPRPLRLGCTPRQRRDLRRVRTARPPPPRGGSRDHGARLRLERRLRSSRRRDRGGSSQRALGSPRKWWDAWVESALHSRTNRYSRSSTPTGDSRARRCSRSGYCASRVHGAQSRHRFRAQRARRGRAGRLRPERAA